jgi:nucleoside-diphosphate-sugar epimerase
MDGKTEAQMPDPKKMTSWMQPYAHTKALGEIAVTEACSDKLLAVSVAPHQLYGPRDNLFLPNMMEAAGSGKLRIFSSGLNRICFTHIDNYAHALVISERQLYKDSPVLGKFYITTDGDTHPGATDPKKPGAYCVFWKEIDKAVVGLGFPSLWSKFKLPFWFLYILGLAAEGLGWLLGTTFKLNVFNVFVLTMHRWFDISAAENDLKFTPIIPFNAGWADTIEWFKKNWKPQWEASADRKSFFGIARQSQAKIDIQADSALGGKKQ